ncbi:MAG TPA: tyrosine--tRNA ligase [Gemmatimonas aurantiaca]|uniref:Tyrosine--tRNA ligase n=2 Tax=Gemmatimonas aurantiaca TaxID=173480 RepID=C1A625_GEMAT|nr:tyrosine--tRNA ligase [Gemmatimonas aurantiaca]BAH37685.1 tyrosyl-tRNA synthetase [Gemmatimonas aurantiaca T-27]HCT58721.1 tyrosine--tRNA ligase [Gemmatimonas aurantiaca]
MSARPSLLDELAWRELISQHTEGLPAALAAGTVSGYCGFDPTASSLHVGNLIPIMGLMHLQRAGHRPYALVGGATGMIGDPSGRASERVLQGLDAIHSNAEAIRGQLSRFLDFDGPRGAKLVNNVDWLSKLSVLDFLRETGKHFSVNYMLAKDSVKSRIDGGISYTEFSYMLLQAHDFWELNRSEGVTLQFGGSDQWGNITAGLELIRRSGGADSNGLTFPLITNADGSKFGKSTGGGSVWLDPERTSPYQFYQFWMGADDRDASRYLRYYTLFSLDEVTALDAEVRTAPEKRAAQRALAVEVTSRVHSAEAARVAQEVSALLFEKADPQALSGEALKALRAEIPFAEYEPPAEGAPAEGIDVYQCLTLLGIAASRGAAKRLLEQGGVSVNGVKLGAADRVVGEDRLLRDRHLLVRKGQREFGLIQVP